jgi:hypothetical protein
MSDSAELRRLTAALLDGELDAAEQSRLEQLVVSDVSARRCYIETMFLLGKLQRMHAEEGRGEREESRGERVADSPESPAISGQWPVVSGRRVESRESRVESCTDIPEIPVINLQIPTLNSRLSTLNSWTLSYSVATVLLAIFLLGAWSYTITHPGPDSLAIKNSRRVTPSGSATSETPEFTFVGRVSGMVDCQWADEATATSPGAGVALNRRYSLKSGLMEISYDSGAKVILQGPCDYTVESARGGFLQVGKLTARVASAKPQAAAAPSENPKSLIPSLQIHSPLATSHSPQFTVRTPTALITDLGTEFGVEVAATGETASHVFQGQVRVRVEGSEVRGQRSGTEKSEIINQKSEIVLSAGQSAQVGRRDSECAAQRESVPKKIADPARFVRKMPIIERPLPVAVLAHFRLGEDDSDAAAGMPMGTQTAEHFGVGLLEKCGSPRYTTDTALPSSSMAVQFLGGDRECLFCPNLYQSPVDNFILEAWVRINRPARWPTYVIHNGSAPDNGYGILLWEKGWAIHLPWIETRRLDVPYEIDQWTHVALVRERGELQFWVNGRLAKSLGNMPIPKQPGGPFMIGGVPESIDAQAYSLNGQVDEVRLSEFRGQFQPKMLLFEPLPNHRK